MAKPVKTPVPGAQGVICRKPPEKVEEMGSGQPGDAMPGDSAEIEVFDALAIDVDFEFVSELRYPLDDHALSAVALVQKR